MEKEIRECISDIFKNDEKIYEYMILYKFDYDLIIHKLNIYNFADKCSKYILHNRRKDIINYLLYKIQILYNIININIPKIHLIIKNYLNEHLFYITYKYYKQNYSLIQIKNIINYINEVN